MIFDSRSEGVNQQLDNRVLGRRNSKGPGKNVPGELQEPPGGQCGFLRWGLEPGDSSLL